MSLLSASFRASYHCRTWRLLCTNVNTLGPSSRKQLPKMSISTNLDREAALKLLRDHTTKKHYIEYRRYLSNHLSQGWYALQYLNAPIERIQKYIDYQVSEKLESAGEHRQREIRDDPQPENVQELLGARKSYYFLYDHYEKLLNETYEGSIDKLVTGELPKIYHGLVGTAFHGVIQLGYGFASREPWFVCEGLAYLHHSSVPLVLTGGAPDAKTLGLGSQSILDVIELIRADADLIKFMKEEIKTKAIAELISGNFQRKVRVLFQSKADTMAEYIHKIQFPEGLNARDLTPEGVPRLAKWLVDCAIIVYAIADTHNDFFLLHGVTSAWSLKTMLPLLSNQPEVVIEIARTYLCGLFAAYLAVDSPGLHKELLSSKESLSHSWESLVTKALEHENYGEEHIYKLVQVCKEMSVESTDDSLEPIYRLACYNCVSFPLII